MQTSPTHIFGYKELTPNWYSDYFLHAIKPLNNIEGIFVELGFGKGDSASTIVSLMEQKMIKVRDSWFFDSFEGFPSPSKEDLIHGDNVAIEGRLKFPIDKANEVSKSVDKLKAKGTVVKGYFEHTLLNTSTLDRIAVLHLDCDLYSSYRTGLNALFDLVVPGGVILFDEYKSQRQFSRYPGASKAIDEFFLSRKLSPVFYRATMKQSPSVQKFFIYK